MEANFCAKLVKKRQIFTKNAQNWWFLHQNGIFSGGARVFWGVRVCFGGARVFRGHVCVTILSDCSMRVKSQMWNPHLSSQCRNCSKMMMMTRIVSAWSPWNAGLASQPHHPGLERAHAQFQGVQGGNNAFQQPPELSHTGGKGTPIGCDDVRKSGPLCKHCKDGPIGHKRAGNRHPLRRAHQKRMYGWNHFGPCRLSELSFQPALSKLGHVSWDGSGDREELWVCIRKFGRIHQSKESFFKWNWKLKSGD